MAVIEKYDMLFDEIKTAQADFKISLDDIDESLDRADFLWEKLSPRNKVGISTELDTNKNLIPCTLSNNKIVLSSDGGGGSQGGENIIVIDSYHIIESTNQIQLSGGHYERVDYVCFPFQFATGQIRTILIQQAQPLGTTLDGVYLAIYANDKPGLSGSRLVWSSPGTYKFDDGGLLSFVDKSTGKCNGPTIPGYMTVDGVRKPNTFFYIMFAAQGSNDGGYKILGINNSVGFNLLSNISGNRTIGKVSNVVKTDAFHEVFDYTLSNDGVDTLLIPHIAFEMIV